MKRAKLFITAGLLASGTLYAAERIYQVEAGDTLSEIAHRNFPGRVWGSAGTLAKLLAANPELKRHSPILPGQAIRLPGEAEVPVAQAETPAGRAPAQASGEAAPAIAPEENDIGHALKISAGYRFTNLQAIDQATGAHATLYTKYDLQLDAAWEQAWSEGFSTYESFSLRRLDFEASTNANKALSDTKKTLARLELGAVQKLSDKLRVQCSIGIGHELFVRGLSTATTTVDKIAVPKFALGAEYALLQRGKTSLSAVARVALLLGANPDGYKVNGGTEFLGGLRLTRADEKRGLSFEAGLQQRQQNSSLVNHREQGVYGQLSFSLPLFTEGTK